MKRIVKVKRRKQFVLQYADGDYFCYGHETGYGCTLSSTKNIFDAVVFGSWSEAVSYKNNESHFRHDLDMRIVELDSKISIIDRGTVPRRRPGWEDYDEVYDQHQFKAAEDERRRRASETTKGGQ